jgi:hypothetical protein
MDRALDKDIGLALEEKAQAHRAALDDQHPPSREITEYALDKKKIGRTELAKIERHLDECADCQREVWLIQDTEKKLVEPQPPIGTRIRNPVFRPILVVAAASAILFLCTTIFLYRELHRSRALHEVQSTELKHRIEASRTEYESRIALLDREKKDLLKPRMVALILIPIIQDALKSGDEGEPVGEPIKVRFPQNVESAALVISVSAGRHRIYKAQIYRANEKIWEDIQPPIKIKGLSAVSITLNKKFFEDGPYTLRIYEKDNQEKLVASRPLLIIKE